MKWIHSRKGPIEGRIVRTTADGEWVDIELAKDHSLRYMAEGNRGLIDAKGETVTVRASLLKEVAP